MELLCRVDAVTDLINALPGNSSVNTVKHATIDEAVFSMLSASRSSLLTDQSTRSLTRNVLSLWSVPRNNRSAVLLCVVRAERIWENTGMGTDLT
jgi:hypothetical protein